MLNSIAKETNISGNSKCEIKVIHNTKFSQNREICARRENFM